MSKVRQAEDPGTAYAELDAQLISLKTLEEQYSKWERRRIDTSTPFESLRRLRDVSAKAKVADYSDFTSEIRRELPRPQRL